MLRLNDCERDSDALPLFDLPDQDWDLLCDCDRSAEMDCSKLSDRDFDSDRSNIDSLLLSDFDMDIDLDLLADVGAILDWLLLCDRLRYCERDCDLD